MQEEGALLGMGEVRLDSEGSTANGMPIAGSVLTRSIGGRGATGSACRHTAATETGTYAASGGNRRELACYF